MVSAPPFGAQRTLNSIMTESFFNSDLTYGTIPSVILENFNQSHLDSSQNSGSKPVLNHNLTQLPSL